MAANDIIITSLHGRRTSDYMHNSVSVALCVCVCVCGDNYTLTHALLSKGIMCMVCIIHNCTVLCTCGHSFVIS